MTMGSSIATWLLCVWLYFSCQRLLKVTTCCRLTQCSLPFMKSESYFLCAERLKRWDSLAFYIISYTSFHSLSHSSFTLISPSVSYFCVTVPSGLVPRSSICQHHPGGVTERMRPGGDTSNVGCWPWFSPPALPVSTSIWVCWPLHLSAHDLELAVAGRKERTSTNDKWQSQNKHAEEGGDEK